MPIVAKLASLSITQIQVTLGANVRPVSVLVLNQMGVTFQKMGGWLGGRKKVNW